MNFSNVRDALATKGIQLRKGFAIIEGKEIASYVLDNGIEPLYLPMIDYDIMDVYHKGLRLH